MKDLAHSTMHKYFKWNEQRTETVGSYVNCNISLLFQKLQPLPLASSSNSYATEATFETKVPLLICRYACVLSPLLSVLYKRDYWY